MVKLLFATFEQVFNTFGHDVEFAVLYNRVATKRIHRMPYEDKKLEIENKRQ